MMRGIRFPSLIGSVRTLEINNEPYFVGKDGEKDVTLVDTLGGNQNMTIP